ncbi:hypothetical protein Tco_0345695 [Tanacetum coccineum]
MGDVIRDVMRHLSFDITDIDNHLEVVSCDVVHFFGSCHEGLSRDETFGTDDLDPPPPFDMNILIHVSIDEGILSDYAKVQDKLDEELGNENESDDVNYASVNEDTHHVGFRVGSEIATPNDNAPLENVTLIEEKDDDDVMIDEENEIHEAEVEVHLFGLRKSDYQFTNIGVSIEVPDNVFMKKDGYEMDIDDFDTDSCSEGNCPVFASSKEVKDRAYLHSTKTRKELMLVRNDKLRALGSKGPNTRKRKKMSVWADADVGGEINGKDQIKVNPRIPVKAVQDILQRELEVRVSMSKAFRAKAKANKEIKGGHYLQYQKLRDYVVELQSTNPNTTVKLAVKRNTNESLPTKI